MAETPNYWDYLQLGTLLSLQGGLEGGDALLEPDELHFIVTHQVFELWFKLALAELRHARDYLAAPWMPEEQVPHVVHHLRRVNSVLRLAVSTFEVMETLTPQDFLSFRDKLTPASGFQSFQMREIELLMGLADTDRIKYGGEDPLEHIRKLASASPGGALAWERLTRARAEQSILSALQEWLFRTPIDGSGPQGTADDQTVTSLAIDAARQAKQAVPGLVLVHVVYGIGFTTLYYRNYYAAFPTELVRAAMIDGAGFFQIFWRIMLPVSGPITVVSVIWQFTNIWNDFLFGASFGGTSQPMTVALNNLVQSSTGVKEYNVHFAGAILAALPTLLVYVVAGRYFVRGLMAGSVKG